jgi:hypothetical protein
LGSREALGRRERQLSGKCENRCNPPIPAASLSLASEAQFKDYITDPKAKIPGTKMVFAGIKNEKEAGDLWAFLAQYDKDGKTK